jgi:hypothetical protein
MDKEIVAISARSSVEPEAFLEMGKVLNLAVAAVIAFGAVASGGAPRADDAEEIVAEHMVGEALLAAHLVALAEKAGMSPKEINRILKDVAASSGIDEFWITDETGRAYLHNEDLEFTFSPGAASEPQASAFWPLLTGEKKVVIQEARKREVDDRVFKYVGVAGIDKPRIVQVGVSADHLPGDR